MRRVVPWLPVLALAIGLFWASSQSNLRFERDEFWDTAIRKTGHVLVYAIGTLLLWYAIEATTRLRPAWAWAAGFWLAFAASDEFHQLFTKGREPTFRDVLIDAVGIAAALIAGHLALRARPRPARKY